MAQGPVTQPPYPAYRPVRDPDRPPGTVVGACTVALACAGVSFAMLSLAVVAGVLARGWLVAEVEREAQTDPALRDFPVQTLADAVIVTAVVLAAWCLVAVVLAVLALRRSQVARILLVVSAGLSVPLSLVGTFVVGLPGVLLAGAVVTIVLLFTGGAGEWYARSAPAARTGPQVGR